MQRDKHKTESTSITQWHALLWSPRQGAFHAVTVPEMLRLNIRAMNGCSRNPNYDWITVALTQDETALGAIQRELDPRNQSHQ